MERRCCRIITIQLYCTARLLFQMQHFAMLCCRTFWFLLLLLFNNLYISLRVWRVDLCVYMYLCVCHKDHLLGCLWSRHRDCVVRFPICVRNFLTENILPIESSLRACQFIHTLNVYLSTYINCGWLLLSIISTNFIVIRWLREINK